MPVMEPPDLNAAPLPLFATLPRVVVSNDASVSVRMGERAWACAKAECQLDC